MNASILNSSHRSGDAFRLKHPIAVGEAEWDQHPGWIFTMLVRVDLASYWTAHGPHQRRDNSHQASCHSRLFVSNVQYPRKAAIPSPRGVGSDKLCPTEVQMPFLPVFTALCFLHTATTTTSFTLTTTTTTNAYIHTVG